VRPGVRATTYRRRISSRSRRILLTPFLRVRPRDAVPAVVRLGSRACGWWVPEVVVRPGAVAYCAGAGEDITFDLELHRRGLTVVTIDPTPRAIAHVGSVKPDDDRFTFLPVGLWHEPAELVFYAPANPDAVSHSALNLQRTTRSFSAHVDSLANLMAEQGHDHIDVLKVDIEGSESTVLPHILEHGPRPAVVCFEYDQPQSSRALLRLLRRFRTYGYQLAHNERWNFTMVNHAAVGAEAPGGHQVAGGAAPSTVGPGRS
jgi:FkbM family methyltransferase